MEKKITLTISAEFYPKENDQFQAIYGHLNKAGQLAEFTKQVVGQLESEAIDGLWFHVDNQKVENK